MFTCFQSNRTITTFIKLEENTKLFLAEEAFQNVTGKPSFTFSLTTLSNQQAQEEDRKLFVDDCLDAIISGVTFIT